MESNIPKWYVWPDEETSLDRAMVFGVSFHGLPFEDSCLQSGLTRMETKILSMIL